MSDLKGALQTYNPVAVAERGPAPLGAKVDTLTALLAMVADDDVGAFAALYDRTCAGLYGVALRVLRDPTSAQDVTKEAYLQVWATADSFNAVEGSAEAWLTTLTHRVAVDRVRSEPCRAARILGCGHGSRVGGCHYVIDAVRHHTVCAAGDELNDSQRETLALAYYGALTYQEVAEFLGEPLSTVTSRIRVAVALLREPVLIA